MQLDLFGATETTATQDAAPPVSSHEGVWRSPEVIAFDDALKRRSLGDAVAILNRVKTEVATRILLLSGFSVSSFKDRAKLMADVQGDLVAAARDGLTGYEMRERRETPPKQVANDNHLSNNVDQEVANDDARTLQTGSIRTGSGFEDREPWGNGSRDRESLGAGLAEARNGDADGRDIPEAVDDPSGDGKDGAVRGGGNDAFVERRDPEIARGADGAAGSGLNGSGARADASGIRQNGEAEIAAADRLEKLLDVFAPVANQVAIAACFDIRGSVEQLRKARTAVNVIGVLERASGRLLQSGYAPQATVVDEVIDSLNYEVAVESEAETSVSEPERMKDRKGNPIFRIGERVEFSEESRGKGRHGAIAEVLPITMRTLSFGSGIPSTSETTYYYNVKTDGGAVIHSSADDLKVESATLEFTPDPVVDGKAMEPDALLRTISYARQNVDKQMALAQRARKAENIAAYKQQAQIERAKAIEYQALWDQWAHIYPDEAAIYAPTKAPSPAMARAGNEDVLQSAGLIVTKGSTKTGKPVWEVTGNTREHSEMLKRMGGRWYGPKKAWSFFNEDPTDSLNEKLGGEIKPETPVAEAVQIEQNEVRLPDSPYIYRKSANGIWDWRVLSSPVTTSNALKGDSPIIAQLEKELAAKGGMVVESAVVPVTITDKSAMEVADSVVDNGVLTDEDSATLGGRQDKATQVLKSESVEPLLEKIAEPEWWSKLTGNERYWKMRASGIDGTASTPWNRLSAVHQRALQRQWGVQQAPENERRDWKGRLLETGDNVSANGRHATIGKWGTNAEGRWIAYDTDGRVLGRASNLAFEVIGMAVRAEEPRRLGSADAAAPALPSAGDATPVETPKLSTTLKATGSNMSDRKDEERVPAPAPAASAKREQKLSNGDDTAVLEKQLRQKLEYAKGDTYNGINTALMFLMRGDVERAERVVQELGIQEDQSGTDVLAAFAEETAEAGTVATPQTIAPDFVLTDEDRIGLGGLGEKFADNYRAIQIVKQLAAEQRHAVPDEQRKLARYVGWGGLKGVFDSENKQWAKQHQALKALLTDREWAAANRSVLDAFYTTGVAVNAIYAAVRRLGFAGGRMLDPSVGVGNFFGYMPEDMRSSSTLHGVELDLLTSQIVGALYPTAHIAKATGFESYRVPAGYFDLVIGNPPFGSQSVVDDAGSVYSGWSIHNYFFAKSVDMLRPGGLMSMVVSHNFLDKLDPHVRQWISRRAELVSAVRLPNTAFKQNANTEVVTDIIVLRRLDDMALGKQELPDWLQTTDVPIVNHQTGETVMVPVNDYFLKNPQNILGEQSAAGSMYHANAYTVEPNGNLEDQLSSWVQSLPEGLYVPMERSTEAVDVASVDVPEGIKEGCFFLHGKDEIALRLPDLLGETRAVIWTPPNQKALERMRGMIAIRTVLRQQMALERSENSTDVAIENGRAALNRVYDAFREKFGFLNDPVNRRLFMDDTESALVQALEFDYEKAITPTKAEEMGVEERPARARKADIFSQRVLYPPMDMVRVDTAKDALLHSLNQYGRVNLDYMEEAYGKDQDAILIELGDLLFNDPVRGIVTADEYLSGDVKTKLLEAKKAMAGSSIYDANVRALEAVIPSDKMPSEIYAAIGGIWIPENVYSQFAKEISGSAIAYQHLKGSGQWLAGESIGGDYTLNNNEYGTDKMGAREILIQMMNGRALEIKKRVQIDGADRYVTDEEATEAVRQKADKIKSRWESWLWSDGDRTDRLLAIYNERFNRTVERKYDGGHLTFPGMNPAIVLDPHQKNGIWRGVCDRTELLDHVVGAGKTYEMATIAMEMRRLGIARKPMFGVPNHLTLQWRSEFYKLYPGANVLAATPADFERDNREKLFSKIVTGNWDAVIIGHSSLKKIGLPPETEASIFQEQLDEISEAVEDMKRDRGDRNIIRDMEKIKSNLEAKLKTLKDKAGTKDKVVDFSDLGVDALFIDELHEFKNLFFYTQMQRIAGLGNPAGSGKAMDLFVKVRWLKETFGQDAPLVGGTGTPVSNSLAEMFTMQRYMQYDRLKALGLHNFDSWAKQYGDVQTVYEVAPSGTGYRLSQRFAKFKNLPSLMSEYRSFADVMTLDDLKEQAAALGRSFPVPRVAGGRPQNIVAERSELQEKFFGVPEIQKDEDGNPLFEIDVTQPFSIVREKDDRWLLRAEPGVYKPFGTKEEAELALAIGATTPRMYIDPKSIVGQFENLRELTRRTKGKINALSLTGLANKAGLDYRLIDPAAPDFPGSKINLSIDRMLHRYEKWHADRGTQLIFCDLSVPLSAKAKMASKEKRLYVRNEAGEVVHKRGTMHVIVEYEGFPYFLVAEGKGKSRTFTMYDAYTGQLLREGFDGKIAAHEWAKRLLQMEDGQEKWLDLRERSRPIESDELDEYKSDRGIDDEGDSADHEITLEDIEGATGVSAFSVYDDIKAKLVLRGVPESEIAFIHDFDTPQAKDALFKRVNDGSVRFLLGSTPKMGAGTNVQKRLVGLSHIDAPWRPSDLEQREGRGIRRGNMLYERDPEGFEIEIDRFATAQTYDTRRWQLLEHKASGVEQLRKYSGEIEIEDICSEAANAADMKAAASGNPLILKETQLATEVKKLRALARAHLDGEYAIRSKMHSNRNWAEIFGPEKLENYEKQKALSNDAKWLLEYKERKCSDKDTAVEALNDLGKELQHMDTKRVVRFRGIEFKFDRDLPKAPAITMPNDMRYVLSPYSPLGVFTRMENFVKGLDEDIAETKHSIAMAHEKADSLAELLGKPFEQEAELQSAIEEHGKVQRALMQANALAAVKPDERVKFDLAVVSQKTALLRMGYEQAVRELDGDIFDVAILAAAEAAGPLDHPVKADETEIECAMTRSRESEIQVIRRSMANAEPIIAPEGIEVVTSGQYLGKVIEVRNGYVTQDIGRGVLKAHAIDSLNLIPAEERFARIRYEMGQAKVFEIGHGPGVER